MSYSLSTRWNASRHRDGASMIGEIRELGFETVELGHDLRMELVPGVRQAVAAGVVGVSSIHNYCPVPLGFANGSPDIYSPCALDAPEWEAALRHTTRTLEFAAEMGASWLVLHGGRVVMPDRTYKLVKRCLRGEYPGNAGYEKLRMRQMVEREKKGSRHLDALRRFLETMLPAAEARGCGLAVEIQPAWESMPTELEMLELLRQFDAPKLRYWHDLGHGQVRENLGFINHERWLQRLEPFLAGMHVHDVAAPARDHLPPGKGQTDFTRFAPVALQTRILVLEPHPQTPAGELAEGCRWLREQWRR